MEPNLLGALVGAAIVCGTVALVLYALRRADSLGFERGALSERSARERAELERDTAKQSAKQAADESKREADGAKVVVETERELGGAAGADGPARWAGMLRAGDPDPAPGGPAAAATPGEAGGRGPRAAG